MHIAAVGQRETTWRQESGLANWVRGHVQEEHAHEDVGNRGTLSPIRTTTVAAGQTQQL